VGSTSPKIHLEVLLSARRGEIDPRSGAAVVPQCEDRRSDDDFFGQSLTYGKLDWAPNIQGSYKSGDVTLLIDESAAWLADRLNKPVPGVDKVNNYSGRPVELKLQDIGNGYTQLYWSNEYARRARRIALALLLCTSPVFTTSCATGQRRRATR